MAISRFFFAILLEFFLFATITLPQSSVYFGLGGNGAAQSQKTNEQTSTVGRQQTSSR
jgi:hypothetical protein